MAAGVRRLTAKTAVMGDRRGPSANGGPYRTNPISADVINQLNVPKEARSGYWRCHLFRAHAGNDPV